MLLTTSLLLLFAVDLIMIILLKHLHCVTQLMEIFFHVDTSELVSGFQLMVSANCAVCVYYAMCIFQKKFSN